MLLSVHAPLISLTGSNRIRQRPIAEAIGAIPSTNNQQASDIFFSAMPAIESEHFQVMLVIEGDDIHYALLDCKPREEVSSEDDVSLDQLIATAKAKIERHINKSEQQFPLSSENPSYKIILVLVKLAEKLAQSPKSENGIKTVNIETAIPLLSSITDPKANILLPRKTLAELSEILEKIPAS